MVHPSRPWCLHRHAFPSILHFPLCKLAHIITQICTTKNAFFLHVMQNPIIFILHMYTCFNSVPLLMQFSAAPVCFPTSRYVHSQPIVPNYTLQRGLFKRRLYTLFAIKECTHRSAFWIHTKIGFNMAHLWCSCMFSGCDAKFTFLRPTLTPIYIETSIRWHKVSICLYLTPSFTLSVSL